MQAGCTGLQRPAGRRGPALSAVCVVVVGSQHSRVSRRLRFPLPWRMSISSSMGISARPYPGSSRRHSPTSSVKSNRLLSPSMATSQDVMADTAGSWSRSAMSIIRRALLPRRKSPVQSQMNTCVSTMHHGFSSLPGLVPDCHSTSTGLMMSPTIFIRPRPEPNSDLGDSR